MYSRQGAAKPTPSQHIAQPSLEELALRLSAALGPKPSPALSNQQHCLGRCAGVPDEVWAAIDCAYPEIQHPAIVVSRLDLATLISPIMAFGGWRFCTCYRMAVTHEHAFVYRLVSTVYANQAADEREAFYRGAL